MSGITDLTINIALIYLVPHIILWFALDLHKKVEE
jgi:hypothetical protein